VTRWLKVLKNLISKWDEKIFQFQIFFFSWRRSLDEKKSSIELKEGEEWAMKWKSKLDIFDCYFFELKRTQRDFSKYLLLLLDSSKHTKNYLLKKKFWIHPFLLICLHFVPKKFEQFFQKPQQQQKHIILTRKKLQLLFVLWDPYAIIMASKSLGFATFLTFTKSTRQML